MGDHQVPSLVENRQNVALEMKLRTIIGWEKVATPSVMAAFAERFSYPP